MRPGTDAFVLLAMLNVLFDEGLARPASYVNGRRRGARRDRGLHPRARRAAQRHRRRRRTTRRARVRRRRVGRRLRPRRGLHAGVRLRLPLGRQPAQRAHRQPRPRGRRDVHPPGRRHGRARADRAAGTTTSGGAGCAGCRSSAASCRSRCSREEIETPGEGQIRALLTLAGNPVLSTPDGAGLDRALAGARLHGGGRHLRQRDHPPRRRDPAADDGARARPLRPGLPRVRGARHRPVHARRAPEGGGRPARLGDLPRAGAAHRRPAGHEEAAEEAAARAGQVPGQPDRDRDRAPRHLASYDDARAARPARRRRPRSADARAPAGAAADEGPPRRRRTRAGAGRPRPAARGAGTRGGRADPGRPAAPARQQLVDAQHRAAHRRAPAAPPAHAPGRPLRARAHRRRAGARGVAGRRGRGRGAARPTT